MAVCTPPVSHERIVVDALEAGKFVMCEKPLAHTLRRRWHSGRGAALPRKALDGISVPLPAGSAPDPVAVGSGAPRPPVVRPIQSIRALRDGGQAGKTWKGSEARQGAGRLVGPLGSRRRWRRHDPVNPRPRSHVPSVWKADRSEADIDTLKEPIESEDTCAATVRFESGALACCYGTMTAHRTASAFDVIGESASAHSPWAFESMDRKRRDQALREVCAMYPPVPAGPGAGSLPRLARGCAIFGPRRRDGHRPHTVRGRCPRCDRRRTAAACRTRGGTRLARSLHRRLRVRAHPAPDRDANRQHESLLRRPDDGPLRRPAPAGE